ncbi:MAG: hypothetical protein QXW76_02400 [Candidatus Korarchaeum sp.]
MPNYRLMVERQLHLMIAGDWESVDPELIEYLEEELGGDPRRDPVGVAFCLLKLGIPPERATSLLNWREFEIFCVRGLQLHGMDTLRGVRFKQGGKGYEVDILGVGDELSLLIDCKMWSMRGRSGRIRSAAKEHLVRTMAFNEAMEFGAVEGLVKEEGRSYLIPVVVSWLEVDITKSREGVALVSLRNFPRFLDSLDEIGDEFLRIEADYRIRVKREALSQRRPAQRS